MEVGQQGAGGGREGVNEGGGGEGKKVSHLSLTGTVRHSSTKRSFMYCL